ncbi:hypothetical protein PF004_g13676 [Phytophthora fragariae]|uniref:No apical meristem-associated C-terminal domain-containing protein n=1 Tax=Phytophthora fragariae TaxID=53985 RepID=A0A6G0NRJ8_9STRA|nr:hypothetical protein PF004_g13676 [Phytophthora fragariae]
MSQARGPNYSIEEDKTLCRAWLSTSGDGGTGTSQSGCEFYGRVKVTFDEELRQTGKWVAERNIKSLGSRFSTISHDVSKFVACHAKVTALEPSGCTPTDIEHQAVELYESVKKNGKFRFLQCWSILKDSPKWGAWRMRRDGKSTPQKPTHKRTERLDDSDTTATATSDQLQSPVSTESSSRRPVGQKRSKLEETNSTLYARQVQAAERMARNGEARNRVARVQVDLNIFSLAPNSNDPEAMEYVRLQRKLILAHVRSEAAALEAGSSVANEDSCNADSTVNNSTPTPDANRCSNPDINTTAVPYINRSSNTNIGSTDPVVKTVEIVPTSAEFASTSGEHASTLSDASILLSL